MTILRQNNIFEFEIIMKKIINDTFVGEESGYELFPKIETRND